MNDLGVPVDFIPPDAHWQLGTIERHNAAWRIMANKVIDSIAVINKEQLEIVILTVNNTKNTMYRRNGRSPMQAVFGRCPRVASEMLSDDSILLMFPEFTLSEQQEYSALVRSEALKAFSEFEVSSHIKRSMSRQTRETAYSYEPGQRVAFWRSQTRRGVKRSSDGITTRPKYLIGTYLGRQPPPDSNLFVQYMGRQYLCAPENVRPAVGFEQWTPSKEDVEEILKAQRSPEVPPVPTSGHPGPQEPDEPNVALDDSGNPVPDVSGAPFPPGISSLPTEPSQSSSTPQLEAPSAPQLVSKEEPHIGKREAVQELEDRPARMPRLEEPEAPRAIEDALIVFGEDGAVLSRCVGWDGSSPPVILNIGRRTRAICRPSGSSISSG